MPVSKPYAFLFSLRFRITLAVTIVFVGISTLVGGLILSTVETYLIRGFDRALQSRAQELLGKVAVAPVVVPLPGESEKIRINYQYQQQNRLLFQSPDFPQGDSLTTDYRQIAVHSQPNDLESGQVTLTLAMSMADLQQDLRSVRWKMGLSLLASLLLALLVGYGVAGWSLRPIQTIIRQTNQIETTQSITRLPLPPAQDELYTLTETLNQMLERLRSNAQLQSNFFAAAAHELRTPLTILKTGLEINLSETNVPKTIKAFLADQLDEINRLCRLLEDFLLISRSDQMPVAIRQEPVLMNALLERAQHQLEGLIGLYEVSIAVDPAFQTQLPIWTDPLKAEHILINLLENAIKYAASGSVIRVGITVLFDQVIWSVENQTEQKSNPTQALLEPFYQGDPLKQGHGLGLWLTHRLVALLGGQLTLTWKNYLFRATVSLPLAPGQ